jgi:hypothetical protein
VHLWLIPVLAKIVGYIGLVHPELHIDHALAEILQQESEKDAYDRDEFHAANLNHFSQKQKKKIRPGHQNAPAFYVKKIWSLLR